MLESVDKMLLRVKTIEFYEMPSLYHSNTTLHGGGGKLGLEKCEKSAIRSNNFGNDCKMRKLDVNDNSILSPHHKWSGYQLFFFLPKGGPLLRFEAQTS